MPYYTLLVPVFAPTASLLYGMLESLQNQTFPDWEARLLVADTRPQDLEMVQALTQNMPKVLIELRPEGELAAWACNALLPQLGNWVGFLGQHDCLTPDALVSCFAAHGTSVITYTDQESFNGNQVISLRSDKGAVNPIRLRQHEYLQELLLINRSWLEVIGGFDRLASDCPTHDIVLKACEELGSEAFAYVPQRLYRRYRGFSLGVPYPPFDTYAITQHLKRTGRKGKAIREGHAVDLQYTVDNWPEVVVHLLVGDDINAGTAAIRQTQNLPLYPRQRLIVHFQGLSPTAPDTYSALCAGMRLTFRTVGPSLPAYWNQVIAQYAGDSTYTLLLGGVPVGARWLHTLVEQLHDQPGVGIVGARCITSTRLHQPGVLGYRYDGWDWNTRGKFDVQCVHHQISAVSPACMLFDTRLFLRGEGFDETLPTLYGMDFCLRYDAADRAVVLTPDVTVSVEETVIPVAEQYSFQVKWAGWTDRFNLHLPL